MIYIIEDSSKECEKAGVQYTLYHYPSDFSDKSPFIDVSFPDTPESRRVFRDVAEHEIHTTLLRHSAVGSLYREVSPELVQDRITNCSFRLQCSIEHEIYVPPLRRIEDSIESQAYLLVMKMWGDFFIVRDWKAFDPYGYGGGEYGYTFYPERE